MLNAHQSREQDSDGAKFYLEKGAAASAENLKEVTVNYDRRMNEILTQLAKGEMPEITPIGWASNYDANDTTWLLQAGGLELLAFVICAFACLAVARRRRVLHSSFACRAVALAQAGHSTFRSRHPLQQPAAR
jgi:hypothetical protein